MIDSLSLRNFKRFASLELELAPLTVLTGVNSGGKSSILQALLLLHSQRLHGGTALPLNGPHGLALGEAMDVLHDQAIEFQIEILISGSGATGGLLLEVPSERSATLVITHESLPEELPSLRGAERSFVYLCAERLGPRDLQEVAADFEADLSVGAHGEYTAHVLSQLGRSQIADSRRHPDTDTEGGIITLAGQAEQWMSSIVCPLKIRADWLPDTNAAILRFKGNGTSKVKPTAERGAVTTDWLRPANVGFGISYALPIVVAGLTAAPGGLLIVENPESHLHPAGQSAMGKFLTRIAAAGTQVVLETHSDHVLNGIRVAIASWVLPADSAIVHYFSNDQEVIALTIDARGAISDWPSGFFDQAELDLGEIANAKRRG